jgi:hypothetical protein
MFNTTLLAAKGKNIQVYSDKQQFLEWVLNGDLQNKR